MVQRISEDQHRFRDIVRGRIRDNLKKYVSSKDLVSQRGKKNIRVPVREVRIPHFQFDFEDTGGVGKGSGKPGDPLGQGQPGDGDGEGEAGEQLGEHAFGVEFTPAELAEILGESLELPRIEPKGNSQIDSVTNRYTGIRQTGPESLRHFKHTYRRALVRQVASGTYNPQKPVIIPRKEDMRYRAAKEIPEPESAAVIFYIMDVSGSMGEHQRDLAQSVSFWIDLWIRSHFKKIESRYIVHDAQAKEVDQDSFYRIDASGGTVISSAYKLMISMLSGFPPEMWNIYVFQFSDGDNWSNADTDVCMDLLRERILPVSNLFAYCQTVSRGGSRRYGKDLDRIIRPNFDCFVQDEITTTDEILKIIKTFLGKGR